MIPLPPGTTSDSDAFDFSLASPYTRSVITDPRRIPTRIVVKDYQDRRRRVVSIQSVERTPLRRNADKDLKLLSTFTILPSSASVFGRVFSTVQITANIPDIKLVLCRYTENMEELLEAHEHHILMEHAAGKMRNVRIAGLYANITPERMSKKNKIANREDYVGQGIVFRNALLPGKETLFLRNMLNMASPEDRQAMLDSWTRKIRRVYYGKEYYLDRRPWKLSREHLRLAALNFASDWQHEQTHDLDFEPDEDEYVVDDFYAYFDWENDDEEGHRVVVAGEEENIATKVKNDDDDDDDDDDGDDDDE